jgi:hypothetical protein
MNHTEWNWNKDNMFFLTRACAIEIPHSDDEWEHGLFHYANQCSLPGGHLVADLDEFGRNQIDKLFIRLCLIVHIYVMGNDDVKFKRLSCKKIGARYVTRLEFSNETLEMELPEMVALLEQRHQ